MTAEVHNKLGHTNDVKNHIAEAIKHAAESEKAHANAHTHVTEAVKHLQETIKQKDMQHTMSGVYTQVALTQSENSEKAHADAHKHMTEALKHLKEAEKHNTAGHKDLVTEHLNQSIEHIESIL